ncbi:hypothetical protein SAMN05216312_1261, partial [Cohnella sp. OV330]
MVLNIHEGLDAKELCYTFMKNSLAFMIQNKDWFLFLEQFTTSPFMNKFYEDDDTALMFKSLIR